MLLAAVVAAVSCTVLLIVLLPVLRHRGILDLPNSRSSHSIPTPRGGGLAVVLAICLGTLTINRTSQALVVLTVIAATAAVGLLEDVRGVTIGWRLGAHLAASGVLGAVALEAGVITGGAWLRGTIFLALVLVAAGAVNAVNFMDGINGISAATGIVSGVAFGALGRQLDQHLLSVLGISTAAASIAFLPWNAPRARVFLGDVGSYGLGAVLASCVVLALSAGATVEASVAPLALYFADTGTTLVRRRCAREPLAEPHRWHAYQRLTDAGLSHMTIAGLVLLLTALVSGAGFLTLHLSLFGRVVADIFAVVAILLYLTIALSQSSPACQGRRRGDGQRGRPAIGGRGVDAAPSPRMSGE